LKSLEERFAAWRRRFAEVGEGRKKALLFSQPSKARFRSVSYNSPPAHLLFEIRKSAGNKADPDFVPWPLREAAALVACVRDGLARRLTAAFESKTELIDRLVMGRDAAEADKSQRIRIAPLPSIGHTFADQSIRRVLVEVPPNCPFAVAEVEWAASGLELGVDPDTGEVLRPGAPVLMSTARPASGAS
jgi:CRISPR-associated protein Csb2